MRALETAAARRRSWRAAVGNRARATRLLLAMLAGSLVLSGCDFSVYELPLPGGTDVGEDPIEVTVAFRDVLDLVPQSTVKVNDVNVGRVTEVKLAGQTAEVTVLLRNDVDLPDNAEAEIRQTSLLGEKFVSLGPPAAGASSNELADGDKIPLERSGRNPEVEEVLGSLSLLLNGGGVAQLKTITQELNKTLEGREGTTKSALNQIDVFTTQLADNKATIVAALEDINRLSVAVRAQQPSINRALAELPSAVLSIDRQRDDLKKMLLALDDLSDVGVRVIRQSKTATIEAFRQLQPTLTQLADSGDALVYAFNVFLTYPFVDEVVGRDPQVARSLRMGDYTNLSVQLDIDLADLPIIGLPCTTLGGVSDMIAGGTPLEEILALDNLCEGVNTALQTCVANPNPTNCVGLPNDILQAVCDSTPVPPAACAALPSVPPLLPKKGGGQTRLPKTPKPPKVPSLPKLPGLPNLLNRVTFGAPADGEARSGLSRRTVTIGELMDVYDPALTELLVTPMVVE